jgi:hypothetical protein
MNHKSYLLGCLLRKKRRIKSLRVLAMNRIVRDKEETYLTIMYKILTIASQIRLKIVLTEYIS